ncbi:MAG: DUF1080 domain-containing protein [Planctomycetota bacterium]|nr:DUF1080 domain-containing protein [Planctomycetota bacterium]
MRMGLLLWICAGAVALGAEENARTWNFDADKPGRIAAGFTGVTGQWEVVADDNAPSKGQVLAQVAKSEKPAFNVALAAEPKLKDVDLSVKMKAVAGAIDQGGGPVWRAKDGQNYYVARFNPLEDNYRLYHVVNGKRTQVQNAEVKLAEGWHTLRVTMKGDQIECFIDGQKHIEAKDTTLQEGGAIGLWTKADAQTRFDDLTVSGK